MTHRSTRSFAALAITASLLSGCAQGLPGARPLSYAAPGEARIFTSKEACIHDAAGKEFAGLLAAIATSAASVLLDNFGNALKAGAEGGNLPTVTATRNMTLEPGRVPRCLTLVRGSFVPEKAGQSAVDLKAIVGVTAEAADRAARFNSLKIPDVYRVDQFIELRLLEAPSRKALTYFPVYALINRSLDGAKSGHRDLAINVKFSRPGAQDAGGPVLLADREIGKPFEQEVDGTTGRALYEAPWFAFPNGLVPADPKKEDAAAAAKPPMAKPDRTPNPVPPAASGEIVGGAGLGSDQAQGPAETQDVDPFSQTQTAIPVSVVITTVETRPTNEGLAFVAAVFNGGAKPAISSALGPILNSDTAATQESADLAAQGEFATALGGAKAALIAYCESASKDETLAGRTDRIAKSSAARAAQLKANAAATKLGVSAPFATFVDISDTVPVAPVAACLG